jgi:Rps23 Pro-64 3,4-dihydroxylase Tpa1-like proline 4-hydroxylase
MKFYKDLLNQQELDFVAKTISGDHWGFGYISTDSNKPIWNFDKLIGKPVAELIASKLDGYTLDDWHINGQSIGLHGSPHTDSYSKCSHAFVFFFQDWDYTWGGRLHIFTDNAPMVITPEKNFGVLFDSNLVHYAEAPVVPILRISVGLKLSYIKELK